MALPLEQLLTEVSEESGSQSEQSTQGALAELSLREMRRQRKLTQTSLSKKLKIGQEGISRIEKRSDLYVSTLRGYVEAVGGKLSLIVEFPDRPPVFLAGLGEGSGKGKKKRKSKSATKSLTGSKSGKSSVA